MSFGTVSAELSTGQQIAVKVVAKKIVTIMEKQNIDMPTFVSILNGFESKFEGDAGKLELVVALREATLDTYYGVQNFSTCEVYNDGCNTCTIMDDYAMACTKMACVREGVPSCEVYEGEETTEGQDPVSTAEIVCGNEGGSFNSLYNECEYIDETVCDSLAGTFYECGSACRHEAE